jgi:glycosyltransferase involved in cell wall biosynthesis
MFSIITITHNRRVLLQKAIASVLSQTVTELEHIIVDDGSTDGTAALVSEIQDPRLRYVARPHSGHLSRLRNTGLEQAKGELIVFLDSDDFFEPGCLQWLLQVYRDPAVKTVIYNAFISSGVEKEILFKKDMFRQPKNLLTARLKNELVVYSSCFSFRVLPGLSNRFNGHMRFGDNDLHVRRLVEGGVRIVEQPLVTITKHSGNMSQSSRENPSFIPAYAEALQTLEYLKAGRHISYWLYAQTASLYLYQLAQEFRKIDRLQEARQNYRRAFLKFPMNLKALARYLFS